MARNIEFNEDVAIQKAMEVFWTKGYTGSSMRDLSEAMQMNSSSIYNSIGDKRELFVRCIRSYTEGRMQEAISHSAKIKSPLKAIISFIKESVNTILYGSNSCLAIKTTFEVAVNDPDVQEILRADSDFTHHFLLDLIKKAMVLKEIDADTDAETLTDVIVNSFTGWHESYILHRDAGRIKKMSAHLIEQILK